MTPEEEILWSYLRAHRMCGLHFRRQHVIDRYIVDFYCHAVRLVIEVDGEIQPQQKDYDQKRDDYLRARGLLVLRFNNDDVNYQLPLLLDCIEAACDARADLIPSYYSIKSE